MTRDVVRVVLVGLLLLAAAPMVAPLWAATPVSIVDDPPPPDSGLPQPPCGGSWSCYTTCCGASRFCGSAADVCCYDGRHVCNSGESAVCYDVGCGFPERPICGTYRYPSVDTCATTHWCRDAYELNCFAEHACGSGETPVCENTSCQGRCATYRTCTDLCPDPSTGLETDRMGLVTSTSLALTCSGAGCPTAPVTVQVTVSDATTAEVRGPGGGAFGPTATIVFPAGNPAAQIIEIRGKDPGAAGDRPYLVNLAATSTDPAFSGKSRSVSVTNVDRIDTNACVPDVMRQFGALPVSMNPLPVLFLYGTPYEYQCDEGAICSSHFEGTNRARRGPFLMVTGTTGGASQLMSHELWHKNGVVGPWGDNLSSWHDDFQANLYSYVVSTSYKHAGGLGIFGDFAAVPLEGGLHSTVYFYDITHAYNTIKLPTELYRCDAVDCFDNAGAAAVVKFQGRYIVAVMSNDPAGIDFYISSGGDIRQPQTWTFLGAWSTPSHGYPYACGGISPALAATIQNMDFIQQCDGTIYLASMWNTGIADCTDPGGNDRLKIYQVDTGRLLAHDTENALTQVGSQDFNCVYGTEPYCTFAGGAGIYVSPETRDMILYSSWWHTAFHSTDIAANTPFLQAAEFPFCAVATPGGLTPSQGTFPDHVHVSWTAPPNAESYTLVRDGTPIATTTTTSYDDFAAPACGKATYTVNANRCAHPSLVSAGAQGWMSTLPPGGVPAGPSLRSPADAASLRPAFLRLDWDPVCLAQTYTVQVSTTTAFTSIAWTATTTDPQTFAYASLPVGGPWYWRVRGVTSQGATGSWSTARSFDTRSLVDAVTLEAGYAHSVSLHSDGTVWTWGMNSSGQLGDGTSTNRNGPVRAGTLGGIVAVAGGGFHSVALAGDGTVWTWGSNSDGQLGDGTTISRNVPFHVPGLSGVVGIAAGYFHTLAVRNDGTVWAWGDNSKGQLGDGTTIDRPVPVQATGVTAAAAIAGGGYHSVVTRTDGSVWAWGENSEGELGNGGHTNRSTAAAVPGLTGIVRVSSGAYFNVALVQDGTLRAWGHNFYGELGDGTNTERPSPITVPGISDAVGLAAGSGFTLVLRANGTVAGMGDNAHGQLGDGTTINRNVPTLVAGLTNIVALAAGEDHSLARDDSGRVYAWGSNQYDQVGTAPADQTTPALFADETVVPPVGLMVPVGGELWAPGTAQTVSWTGAGPIRVDMSPDGGTTWAPLTPATSQQDVPIVVPTGWTTARGALRITRVGTPASSAQTGAPMRIAPPPSRPWLVTTLDSSAETTGEFASLALDPWGRSGIAQFDRGRQRLKFTTRVPNGWANLPIDETDSTGWYPSIAYGRDGEPRISYVDSTRATIRFAYRVGGVWQMEDVTSAGCTPPTSVALDTQDRPYIVFACGYVRLMMKIDTDGDGVPEWVDATPLVGGYYVAGSNPVIRMQGDLPRIAYLAPTSPALVGYVSAAWNPFPYWSWASETIAGTDGAGALSLALDPQDNPSIAFYATPTRSLRMARRAAGWTVTDVDTSAGDVGGGSSIALDASGRPRISYLANGLLKFAEWTGSSWLLDVPSATSSAGSLTAVAADAAGNERIAFFDPVAGDLKYALSEPDVTPPSSPALSGFGGQTTAGAGWSAPGDDGNGGGPAWAYDLRYSSGPINEDNFSQATPVFTSGPGSPGTEDCGSAMDLNPCSPYTFALRVFDDVGNVSWVVSIQVVTKCSPGPEVICP